MTATETLLEKLTANGHTPRSTGGGWSARCPAHEDGNPSLSVRQILGQALVYCHAGCETSDVLDALGLSMRDLFDEPAGTSYTYTDPAGHPSRTVHRSPDKRFRQTGDTSTQPQLYRLHAIPEAVADGTPIYLVEGEKDVHALESIGAVATTSPMGSSNWRKVDPSPLAGAHVIVVPDRDEPGERYLRDVLDTLEGRTASVRVVRAKVGKDVADHVAAGYGLEDLVEETFETLSLAEAHAVYRRWLGDSFDLGALDAVFAAAAVERLDGDPVWLLVLSGSGNAKTETVGSLAGAGAYVTSTVTSEGALLSATSKREQTKDATGGLLRKISDHGLLVIKDFTSILSMNRDTRAAVLAALREVYDGRWERNVGTDGGKSLLWTGRIALVGAVTSAYDSAHAVIASMGDRFALVRVDSNLGRLEAGRQALRNVGLEEQMRPELASAAGAVLAGIDPGKAVISSSDMDVLLALANLVTLGRTAVERDYKGEVVEAHAPEAPTRFAKMLGQLVRGGLALGAEHDHALGVAVRVAADSMPPLRLAVLADLLENPGSRTSEVTKRLQKPRSTVDRTLQELHVLGLAEIDETDDGKGWRYRLAVLVDKQALSRLITRNVTTPGYGDKEEPHPAPDISGDAPPSPDCTVCGERLLLHRPGRDTCARCSPLAVAS